MNLKKIKEEIEIEKKATEIKSVTMADVVQSSYEELMETKPEDIISYGYSWLDKQLAGIFKGELILIGGESGCIDENANITIQKYSNTSKRVLETSELSLKKAFKKFHRKNYPQNIAETTDLKIQCFDGRNIVYNKIANIYKSGEKQLYEIELIDGYKLKTTDEHPFLQIDGKTFKRLDELVVGQEILVMRKKIVAGKNILKVKAVPVKIKSIIKKEIGMTYDIEMAESNKNFVVESFIVHNTGKSTFATNIIYKASKKVKCAVFALEERLENYGKKAAYFSIGKLRKISGKKNYPYNAYIRGELNHQKEFQDYFARAYDELHNDNILFQKIEEKLSFDILKKRIEILHNQGVKLILIDHLHYFNLLREGNVSKTDYIEEIMTELHLLLNKTGMSVLLIAHYKKLNGTKPTLDSFKDSISIAQNSDHVINIWRDREQKDTDNELDNYAKYRTTFYIPKTRNVNGEATITVSFNPDTYDYIDPEYYDGGTSSNVMKNSKLNL